MDTRPPRPLREGVPRCMEGAIGQGRALNLGVKASLLEGPAYSVPSNRLLAHKENRPSGLTRPRP
jgi:hypothetical protein